MFWSFERLDRPQAHRAPDRPASVTTLEITGDVLHLRIANHSIQL